MRKSFNTLPTILLALLGTLLVVQAFGHAGRSIPSELRQDEKQKWEKLRKRFTEEYVGYLYSGIWPLTHSDDSRSEVEESLKLLQVLINALGRNDPALLNEIGGVKGFKERFLRLMRSGGDTVSGFAATVLAISGDSSYAPQIAALLEKKDASSADEFAYPVVTVRGRAARALGILGAKEYAPRIVPLLQSKNEYDRAGAATALGLLGAKEYAQDVVKMLSNRDFIIREDSAIYSLMLMGAAAEYKKEIAQVLGEIETERSKTAAYALARLRAKEYAKDIARLLKDPLRKGYAAKALAIMGAKEYAGEIALMLNDNNELNQADALLALGVMNAKEYIPQVAKRLKPKSEKDFVSTYAAMSLVLMDAGEYAKDILPLLKRAGQADAFLDVGSFNPIVEDDVDEINNRFKTSLARMSSTK